MSSSSPFNCLTGLPALEFLALGSMNMTGVSIGDPLWCSSLASSLTYLDLSNSHLHGEIPDCFASVMPYLIFISMQDNTLVTGSISPLCGFPFVRGLSFTGSGVSGAIPSCIFTASHDLRFFFFSRTHLEGPLPDTVCAAPNLVSLYITNATAINGTIPTCIAINQPYMVEIIAENAQLSGELPEALCRSQSLLQLNFKGNRLTGVIPNCLGNVTTLTALDLSGNQ